MKKARRKAICTNVKANGFAFLSSYFPERTTVDAVRGIGTIEKLPGFDEVQELAPKAVEESAPNTYSGNFGEGDFPFHTDLAHWYLPPRYFVLRCIDGTPDVKTPLVDSGEIIRAVGRENLCRTLVQPRRPLEGNRCLLRILERTAVGELRFRWDSIFIRPSTKYSSRMCSAVAGVLSKTRSIDIVLEKRGDVLIVDNWRMLHGRSAIPLMWHNRKIHRTYVSSLYESD